MYDVYRYLAFYVLQAKWASRHASGRKHGYLCVLIEFLPRIPSSSRTRISVSLSFYHEVILPFFDICRQSTFHSQPWTSYPKPRHLPSTLATLHHSCLSSSWNMRRFLKFLQDVRHKDCRLCSYSYSYLMLYLYYKLYIAIYKIK